MLLVKRAGERIAVQPPGPLPVELANLATVRSQLRQRVWLESGPRRVSISRECIPQILAVLIGVGDIAPEESFSNCELALISYVALLEAFKVEIVRILPRERLIHLLLSKPLLREEGHATAADLLGRLIQVAETVLNKGALKRLLQRLVFPLSAALAIRVDR